MVSINKLKRPLQDLIGFGIYFNSKQMKLNLRQVSCRHETFASIKINLFKFPVDYKSDYYLTNFFKRFVSKWKYHCFILRYYKSPIENMKLYGCGAEAELLLPVFGAKE